ncbi:MAG: baseplate J/gp47 family protein [Eubacteriales bacterium]|nr:baseplate J/gp47 family protein [Eubacteriales bacterium]
MYEENVFDQIMQRMLDRVPDDLDKREGSIIWDALAPAALELELMYVVLNELMNQAFADTNDREYLIRRCKERGVTPYPATYAILKGTFLPVNAMVAGKRFNLETLNYVVTEAIDAEAGLYKVQCETTGVAGGHYLGTLVPIDYVDGLESAALTEVLIPGEDEEATEDLRTRYFATFSDRPYGGNRQDYLDKTNAIEGVGATKVTPIWNGAGTVKLTILNSDYDQASGALIASVQDAVDPAPQGTGLGIAPIGHTVTVDTAEEMAINITLTVEFDTGYGWANLQNTMDQVIETYLLELRRTWANNANVIVRVAQIETRLLAVTGIVDVTGTAINGTVGNLTVTNNQIPVFGGISNGA